MKIWKSYILSLFCLMVVLPAATAQRVIDRAVRVSAQVSDQPAKITLMWPANPDATSYKIYRKSKEATDWGAAVHSSSNAITTWEDASVQVGEQYEYRIVMDGVKGSVPYTAYGYILSGIEAPEIEDRGILILLVEKSLTTALEPEIERLIWDMRGDGWRVIRHDVEASASPPDVRAMIGSDYSKDPDNTKAVFLLGHVPVPYSGSIAIDGHVPDHAGAWPCDMYYGELDGSWTDFTVDTDTTKVTRRENWNVPGDGKFDNDILPSDMELQVGRVDLSDMPAFSLTEIELMKRYLDKDHDWRMKAITAQDRALVKDTFNNGEGFGASGWKSFAPMFGADDVINDDWLANVTSGSYMWTYAAGPGSYTSVGKVVKTSEIAGSTIQNPFAIFFGSYFGDWNSTNNVLRAPLAAEGMGLTNAWSGRPHWNFHQMAMGENIGYCALQSQNDYTTYFRGSIFNDLSQRLVSPALMGDPTLRMHMVAPPTNLNVTKATEGVKLDWTASTDASVEGYVVYRTKGFDQPWVRVTAEPVTGATYTDENPTWGTSYYMVRAIALQETASGTYYNLSTGLIDEEGYVSGIADDKKEAQANISLYPNPANDGMAWLMWEGAAQQGQVTVTDLTGREVLLLERQQLDAGRSIRLDLTAQPAGVYMVRVGTAVGSYSARLVVR